MHHINPRIALHLAWAGLGLTAAGALAFLFLKGMQGTQFLRVAMMVQSYSAPGMPAVIGFGLSHAEHGRLGVAGAVRRDAARGREHALAVASEPVGHSGQVPLAACDTA
jgi:hypothetical protein